MLFRSGMVRLRMTSTARFPRSTPQSADHFSLNSLVSRVRRSATSRSRLSEPPPTGEDLLLRFATLACCHCRLQLLCGLCRSVGFGSSLPGFLGSVAFLEAGAASCVASLPERRCEIIAAAVSAEQLLWFARRLGSARSGCPSRYGRSNL